MYCGLYVFYNNNLSLCIVKMYINIGFVVIKFYMLFKLVYNLILYNVMFKFIYEIKY